MSSLFNFTVDNNCISSNNGLSIKMAGKAFRSTSNTINSYENNGIGIQLITNSAGNREIAIIDTSNVNNNYPNLALGINNNYSTLKSVSSSSIYNTSNPIAWYKFDGSATDMLKDETNTYNLINGGATFDTTTKVKGSGSAYFDGSSRMIINGTISFYSIQTSTGISFSFWSRTSAGNDYGKIFSFNNNGTSRYCALIKNANLNNLMFFMDNGGYVTTDVNYFDGTWRHFVWTISAAGDWSIYVNGQSLGVNFNRSFNSADDYSYNKSFGDLTDYNQYTTGNLDDFRIYNFELSQEQISILCESSSINYPLLQKTQSTSIYNTININNYIVLSESNLRIGNALSNMNSNLIIEGNISITSNFIFNQCEISTSITNNTSNLNFSNGNLGYSSNIIINNNITLGGNIYKLDGSPLITLDQQTFVNSQWSNVVSSSNIYFNNGLVGIGITSPTEILHLSSSTNANISVRLSDNSNENGVIIKKDLNQNSFLWHNMNSNFIFGTQNKEQLRLLASGNIGIGTTSPISFVDIRSNLIIDGLLLKPDKTSFYSIFWSNSSNRNNINYQNGFIGIGTDNPQTLLNINSNLIITNGNLGIGITSPLNLIHIHQNANNISSKITLTDNNCLNGGVVFEKNETQDLKLFNNENNSLILGTSNQECLKILNNGNIGIGTTTPTFIIDINGNLTTTEIQLKSINVSNLIDSNLSNVSNILINYNNHSNLPNLSIYATTTGNFSKENSLILKKPLLKDFTSGFLISSNSNITLNTNSTGIFNYTSSKDIPAGTYNITFTNGKINIGSILSDNSYTIARDSNAFNINPIAWYKFDESTNLGLDSSGNGFTLTNTSISYNSTRVIKGTGTAEFDGSTNYFSSTDSTLRSFFNKKSFSISLWLYPKSDTLGFSFAVGTSGAGRLWGGYGVQASGIYEFSFITATLASTAYTDANTWVYITYTYNQNSSTKNIYRNGVLIATQVEAAVDITVDNIYIGRIINTSSYKANCIIDDLRFYDVELTQSQVKELYLGRINIVSNNKISPFLWYKFNDNNTNMLIDSSGTNNLTNNQATFDTTTYATGNGSIRFGSSKYVTITNNIDFYGIQTTTGISYCFWVKVITLNTWGSFFQFNDSLNTSSVYYSGIGKYDTYNYLNVWLFNGSFDNNVAYISNYTVDVLDGNWHHIAWTISKTGVWTVYFDGQNQNVSITAGYSSIGDYNVYKNLGFANTASAYYYDGNMDDFRIYNLELTQSQVTNIYNKQEYLFGKDSGITLKLSYNSNLTVTSTDNLTLSTPNQWTSNNLTNVINYSSGNVGIGTTIPTQIFQIGNKGQLSIASGITDNSLIGVSNNNTTDNTKINLSGRDNGGFNVNGDIQYYSTGSAGKHLFYSTDSTTERIRIANNGFVGINNNNPLSQLHTSGDIRLSGDLLKTDGTLFNPISSWINNTTNIYLNTGSASIGTSINNTNFKLEVINNAAIGTPVSANVNNGYSHATSTLTVTNTTPVTNVLLNDNLPVLHLCREGTSGQSQGARATFKISRYENSSVNSRTRLNLELSHNLYSTDVNVMNIYSGRLVGIGGIVPLSTLHVSGDIRTSGNVLDNSGNSLSSVYGTSWTTNGTAINYTTGNIGLGINSPQSILHLHSSSTSTDVNLRMTDATTSSSASDGIIIRKDTSQNGVLMNFENADFSFGTNGSEKMKIKNNGTVGIGVTNPYNTNLLHIHNATSSSPNAGILLTDNPEIKLATDTNLVLWYKMNTSSTEMLKCSINANNNAWASNSPLFDTGCYATGTGSINFTATTGNFLRIPNNLDLNAINLANGITFAFFAKLNDRSSDSAQIFLFGTANTANSAQVSRGVGMYRNLSASSIVFEISNPAVNQISSTSRQTYTTSSLNFFINNYDFYHYVWTITTAGLSSIYVNGVLDGSFSSGTIPVFDKTYQFNYIGNSIYPGRLLDGNIDDFRIYNKVLSSSEITELNRVASKNLNSPSANFFITKPITNNFQIGTGNRSDIILSPNSTPKLYITQNNNVEINSIVYKSRQAFFPTTKPWAIYFAEDFNTTTNQLLDSSGNGRHATGSGIITKQSASGNGATQPITFISGTIDSKLSFPAGSIPSSFTIMGITRFTSTDPMKQDRILRAQGTSPNWGLGHVGGITGVFYANSWMTPTANLLTTRTNWLCSIAKSSGTNSNNVIMNSVSRGSSSYGLTGTYQLGINTDSYWQSDWALSMVVIWDSALIDRDLINLTYTIKYDYLGNNFTNNSLKNYIYYSTCYINGDARVSGSILNNDGSTKEIGVPTYNIDTFYQNSSLLNISNFNLTTTAFAAPSFGTGTALVNNYEYKQFTANSSFTITQPLLVDLLLVGAGGNGGSGILSGGGGAGEIFYFPNYLLNTGSYDVIIGQSSFTAINRNTILRNPTATTDIITAIGGGDGGGFNNSYNTNRTITVTNNNNILFCNNAFTIIDPGTYTLNFKSSNLTLDLSYNNNYPVLSNINYTEIQPILWYKFDNNANDLLLDSSPSLNHLWNSNATLDVSVYRRGNGSLRIDYNKYVVISKNIDFYGIQTTAGISFSFWIKIISTVTWSSFFQFNDTNGYSETAYSGIGKSDNNNSIDIWLHNGSINYVRISNYTVDVLDGNWHHICWTIAPNGKWSAYFDGENQNISKKAGYSSTGNYNAYKTIGYALNTSYYTNAYIDDFRIYNIELTQIQAGKLADKQADYNYTYTKDLNGNYVNPIAWYKFDDSTNLGLDASGNGYHLTNTSTVNSSNDAIKGTNSAYFNGTAQYLSTSSFYNLTGYSYTISFWAKRYQNDVIQSFLQVGSVTATLQRLTILYLTDNTYSYGYYSGESVSAAFPTEANKWIHHALTFKYGVGNRQAKWYRNGTVIISYTLANDPTFNNYLQISTNTLGFSNYYNGLLKDLRFFNVELSSSQILDLYNGRIELYSKPQSGGSGGGGFSTVPINLDPNRISVTGTGNSVNNATNDTNFRYAYFANNGTLTFTSDFSCDILIVGGGGGGGNGTYVVGKTYTGGGGGAGACIYLTNYFFTAGTYNITIGSGGASATNGSPSIITNSSSTVILKADGGGAGGTVNNINGNNGGSGGGSGSYYTYSSSSYTSGSSGSAISTNNIPSNIYGNNGTQYNPAGGGGGANSSGSYTYGGAGKYLNITGNYLYYSTGGTGAKSASTVTNASANTGNGGDGANGVLSDFTTKNGGIGGSGVLIIRYQVNIDPLLGPGALGVTNNLKQKNPSITGSGNAINNYIGYLYANFVNNGTLIIPENIYCDILVVGGGGYHFDAPGGAGACIYLENYLLTAGNYTITVGVGGDQYTQSVSSTSSSTIYNNTTSTTIVNAIGGGPGGRDAASSYNGISGGSGGGAFTRNLATNTTGGAALSTGNIPAGVYGFKGGDATYTSANISGGGGGAGGPGGNASGTTRGLGGPGKIISITGTAVEYAMGGVGFINGVSSPSTPGSGGSWNNQNGYKGIVIIRYKEVTGSLVYNGNNGTLSIGGAGGGVATTSFISGTAIGGAGIGNDLSSGGINAVNKGAGGGGNNGNGAGGLLEMRYSTQLTSNLSLTTNITTVTNNLNSTNVVTTSDKIGLSTPTPSCLLDITATGTSASFSTTVGLLHSSGASSSTSISTAVAKATGAVWTTHRLVASSDSRIKTNINDINDNEALQKLMKIEPKTYNYIDYLKRGTSKVYGFLAQQVREVLPEAVKLESETIPNIYKIGEINSNQPNEITIINENNSNFIYNEQKLSLKINDDIRIITENEDNNYKITDVITSNKFIIDKPLPNSYENKCIVYGTKVNDFHTLDKNYIYTLNVCATQDLHKQLSSNQVKLNNLKEKINLLTSNYFR